jgi:RNA polymerase sigma-70 factor (ECF subfamily)
MDTLALIRTSQNGSREAFNQLVLSYQDQVFTHACYLLGERELAEDITQEVFIRAYLKLGTFRGGSFRAWLLRIASNACYDELRRIKRSRQLPAADLPLETSQGEDPLDAFTHPLTGVEEQVEQRDLFARALHGLSLLPLEYRSAAILVDVLGLNYAEAAASLGVPQGTIKSRLARARKGIRDRLMI